MLYELSRQRQQKIELAKKVQAQQMDSHMKRVHTTDKSKHIIEELKVQHFSSIFRQLDSDSDGAISAQRIDLDLLAPELLGVMQQVLVELEETAATLSEEEFIDALYRLYDVLPPPQKKVLFNPKEVSQ